MEVKHFLTVFETLYKATKKQLSLFLVIPVSGISRLECVKEAIIVEVEMVVNVPDDPTLDQVPAVGDGVRTVAGQTQIYEPVHQLRATKHGPETKRREKLYI